MSLLFFDGFDHYATANFPAKGWNASGSCSIASGAGRRTGSSAFLLGMNAGQSLARSVIASGATAIVGFAVKTQALGVNLVQVYAAGAAQVILTANGDGSLSVSRSGGPTLGTSAVGLMVPMAWYHIEMKVVIHATAGSIVVRLNGAPVINVPIVNTLNTSAAWNSLLFATGVFGGWNIWYDDLYVCDGTGAAPWNDLLGDCRIDSLMPTAPGATTGWTPSTGANWATVDDNPPNDDTDYTSAAAVLTDTFVTQDLPSLGVGGLVMGVQAWVSAKKSDAGTGSVAPVVRHSGVDYPGTAVALPTNYTYVTQIYQTNPGTGVQWTEADVNAAEFGYKRTA